jgi:glutaredoxin-related protein
MTLSERSLIFYHCKLVDEMIRVVNVMDSLVTKYDMKPEINIKPTIKNLQEFMKYEDTEHPEYRYKLEDYRQDLVRESLILHECMNTEEYREKVSVEDAMLEMETFKESNDIVENLMNKIEITQREVDRGC